MTDVGQEQEVKYVAFPKGEWLSDYWARYWEMMEAQRKHAFEITAVNLGKTHD